MDIKDCPHCWYEVLGGDSCDNCGARFTQLIANDVDWEEFPVDLD